MRTYRVTYVHPGRPPRKVVCRMAAWSEADARRRLERSFRFRGYMQVDVLSVEEEGD